eukprot:Awhi_evm2s11212
MPLYRTVDEALLSVQESEVRTLTLRRLSIDTNGAEKIANMLKENQTLTKLNVGYNKLGSVGLHPIVEALKVNTSLTSL